MQSPFIIPPSVAAQAAAKEVMERVHGYMSAHPESELHQQGKMFGVLLVKNEGVKELTNERYLAAFSAQLDGSYFHEGFVPPVYAMTTPPIGKDKADSQRLQRLLFAQYNLLNGRGETKNLLEIFQSENRIFTPEEWFSGKGERLAVSGERMPPSGAGECCAPKLLQYAFAHHLTPLALAEFWVGAPSRTEVRQEGVFYPPCAGRCVPILRHMLQGIEVISNQPSVLSFQVEIVYEDDYLMVVNKPSGLLSVPGKSDEPCVEKYVSHLRPNLNAVKAVHRLDQDTSGLLVLAKTPDVYKTLQAYFQRRDILKRYEAVVRPNHPSSIINHQSEGIIDLPLLPNPYDRPRQMVDKEHGKPAITRYVVRERKADGTVVVDFYPQTGRTHQLRVHAAHPEGLNAPIVGDRLYNGAHIAGNGQTGRLMLHAAEIRFLHPITQEEMHFCIR